MKIFLSIIIFILFCIPNSLGQSEVRLSQKDFYNDESNTGDFKLKSSTAHFYFPSGKIKESITNRYDGDEGFIQREGVFYIYDGNGELLLQELSRRYNLDLNIWITESWIEYVYDDNGCVIERAYIENVGGARVVDYYERNEDCQIVKESSWFSPSTLDTFSLIGRIEITYFQDGKSYELKLFRENYLTGEIFLVKTERQIFNDDGLLIEYEYQNNDYSPDNWSGRKKVYTYDQNGNKITQLNYSNSTSHPDWRFYSEYSYYHEYDHQNRVIKTRTVRYDIVSGNPVILVGGVIIHDISYQCKDLIEEETTANLNAGIGNGIRYEYKYEGISECYDVENVLLEMSVYPNPSNGVITIQSPVLQSGDTSISVFGVSGKVLLQKNEKQIGKTKMDLSHLPNGVYIVQLISQEHFVQEKIFLLK